MLPIVLRPIVLQVNLKQTYMCFDPTLCPFSFANYLFISPLFELHSGKLNRLQNFPLPYKLAPNLMSVKSVKLDHQLAPMFKFFISLPIVFKLINQLAPREFISKFLKLLNTR